MCMYIYIYIYIYDSVFAPPSNTVCVFPIEMKRLRSHCVLIVLRSSSNTLSVHVRYLLPLIMGLL